jgi:hypothetical protein
VNTASCKAKGRRLQQLVRDRLRNIGKKHGLEDGDVESTGMGQSGVDVLLSPAAYKIFPFDIECKNVEALNVVGVFQKHLNLYGNRATTKLLVHARNRTEPMVTLRLEDFLNIYDSLLALRRIAFEISDNKTE